MNAFVQRNPSIADLAAIGGRPGLFASLSRWAKARKQANALHKADRQLWETALADPRIMAEIQRAESEQAGERLAARFIRNF